MVDVPHPKDKVVEAVKALRAAAIRQVADNYADMLQQEEARVVPSSERELIRQGMAIALKDFAVEQMP